MTMDILTVQEWNLVLAGLANLPYKDAAPVIDKLKKLYEEDNRGTSEGTSEEESAS